MPVANSGGFGGGTSILFHLWDERCRPAPLCDPSTSGGNPAPSGGYGLTIDASILALQGSFIVNNYQTSNTTDTDLRQQRGDPHRLRLHPAGCPWSRRHLQRQ